MTPEKVRVKIYPSSVEKRDLDLARAIDSLLPMAFEKRHGLLVTRCSAYEYHVEVSGSVPCGVILESRTQGADPTCP